MRDCEILAVVNTDSAAMSQELKLAMQAAEKNGTLSVNTGDIPKSMIVSTDKQFILCGLNTDTLKKRISKQNI